ncbi:Retinol-Binding Protein 3, partial [Manis pentadactyla]
CQNLLTSDQSHRSGSSERLSLRCGPQLWRVCTSCGQVPLNLPGTVTSPDPHTPAPPPPKFLILPMNSEQSRGLHG